MTAYVQDPSAPQPPPPRPATPSSSARLRLLGIIVACSTPLSGFLSFAVAAIVFGEDRLEGPDGLSPAGWAAIVLPLIIGLGLVAAGRGGVATPGRRTIGITLSAIAVLLLALGLWSVNASADTGDASIGGGLLVLAAIPLAVVGAGTIYSSITTR